MVAARETRTATVLVIAPESSGSIFCSQAPPETGNGSEFIKKAAFNCIAHLGHTKVRLKSDRYIKEKRSHDTMILDSPRGPHQSNGFVKRSTFRLEGMVQTLRSEVFASTGIDETATSPLSLCLVRHVGWLLSHNAVGRDGSTCYQRLLDVPVPKIADGRRRVCVA